MTANCGRCHGCGDALTSEEWCATCRQFRRYFSHGWNSAVAELSACEDAPALSPPRMRAL